MTPSSGCWPRCRARVREHTVVLRGNAVNYAVAGQGVPGLTVGEWKQTQAPKMDRDVLDLIEKRKIPVYVVAEDLADRGIERGRAGAGRTAAVTDGAARALRRVRAGRPLVARGRGGAGSVNCQANALLGEIAALIRRSCSCQRCHEDSHPAHMQGSLPG